jgi:hypothetical protein
MKHSTTGDCCVTLPHPSAGASLGRNRCVDANGTTLLVDPYQWPVSHAEDGKDRVLQLSSAVVARGSRASMRLAADQGVPLARAAPGGTCSWLRFTRLQGVLADSIVSETPDDV